MRGAQEHDGQPMAAEIVALATTEAGEEPSLMPRGAGPNLMPRKKPWPADAPLDFPQTGHISNDPATIRLDEHLVWQGRRLDRAYLCSIDEDMRDEIAKDVFNFLLSVDFLAVGHDEEDVRRDFGNLRASSRGIEDSGGMLSVSNCGASGHTVYRHFFPNMLRIRSGNRPSVLDVLSDRRKLWQVVRNRIGNTLLYAENGERPHQWPMPMTVSQIVIGAKNSGLAGMGSVFKPDVAKAIYRRWVGDGQRVLDYSCGFGTRLLGLRASGIRATYLGYEPNTETHRRIMEMAGFLGFGDVDIRCAGSEVGEPFGDVDFAFSSPPYFSHERYCDEPTQSCERFPEYHQWLEGYWRATVSRIAGMLVPDGVFGVNIGNKANGGMRTLEADARRIVEEEGFEPVETIWMMTSRSHLSGKKGTGDSHKMEGIFLYRLHRGRRTAGDGDPMACSVGLPMDGAPVADGLPVADGESGFRAEAPSGDCQLECADMLEAVPRMGRRPALAVMSPPDMSEMRNQTETYERFLAQAYKVVADVLVPGGVLVSSTTDRRLNGGIYPKHVFILGRTLEAGLLLEDYKIWAKTMRTNLYIPTFTHVMVFRKPGARGTKNHVPEFLPDVWDIPLDKVKGYPNHDAFPTDLVRRVVARYTMSGDLVLDPFIGSGKTAVACLELGRRCVGFDTSSEAVLALRNRIGC